MSVRPFLSPILFYEGIKSCGAETAVAPPMRSIWQPNWSDAFIIPRAALASIALTTNTSVLTAIANDFGFDEVFERQVEALCQPGDVLVGISTSGNSRNVCAALDKARELRAATVVMTGNNGARMAALADACIRVPSDDTARVQEAHILFGHVLCQWVELASCINHAVSNGGNAR